MCAINARGALRCGVLLAATSVLVGCPIPIPAGYQAESRENVRTESLDWVTVGVTTRTDVLMKLGEADGEAPDGSWLAYGSAYAEGGVIFVIFGGSSGAGAGGERVEYRRLVFSLDDRAVVSAVDVVTRECWESILAIGSDGGRTAPCLKVGARE